MFGANTAVAITTLNEEASIAPLCYELNLRGYNIFIVDAGSTDNTVALARCFTDNVEIYPGPIGPCLMRAWQSAIDKGYERIVQIDAGFSHDVNDIPVLLRALRSGADFAIGSRFVPGAIYYGDSKRKAFSITYAQICNLITGAKIHDWTSGFRAFYAETAKTLLSKTYQAKMHSWQSEVLHYAIANDIIVAEVPIIYKRGVSSMSRKVAIESIKTLINIYNRQRGK